MTGQFFLGQENSEIGIFQQKDHGCVGVCPSEDEGKKQTFSSTVAQHVSVLILINKERHGLIDNSSSQLVDVVNVPLIVAFFTSIQTDEYGFCLGQCCSPEREWVGELCISCQWRS